MNSRTAIASHYWVVYTHPFHWQTRIGLVSGNSCTTCAALHGHFGKKLHNYIHAAVSIALFCKFLWGQPFGILVCRVGAKSDEKLYGCRILALHGAVQRVL